MLSYGIFQTSWVKPAPYACQPKNQAAKTPRADFFEFGAAADEVENRSQVTSVVWARAGASDPAGGRQALLWGVCPRALPGPILAR